MNLVYMCMDSGNFDNKISKIKNKIRCMLGILKIRTYENNKKVIIVPFQKEINSERIIKKIKKKIIRQNTIIVLDKCEKLEKIRYGLIKEKYNVLEENYLFSHMVLKIIEFIAKKQSKIIEEYNVSILVNERTKQNINQIIKLSRKSEKFKCN